MSKVKVAAGLSQWRRKMFICEGVHTFWVVPPTLYDGHCIKTAKRKVIHTTLRDNPGTLVFWRQQSFSSLAHVNIMVSHRILYLF